MRISQPVVSARWAVKNAALPSLGATFAVAQLSQSLAGFGGGYGQAASVVSALAGAATVGYLATHPQAWTSPAPLRWITAGARKEALRVAADVEMGRSDRAAVQVARRAGGVAGGVTGAVIGTQIGLALQEPVMAMVEQGISKIPTPLPPLLATMVPWALRSALVMTSQGLGASLGGWIGQAAGWTIGSMQARLT